MWSELFLGTKIKGIWHTGLVAYGLEYFYGEGYSFCLSRNSIFCMIIKVDACKHTQVDSNGFGSSLWFSTLWLSESFSFNQNWA